MKKVNFLTKEFTIVKKHFSTIKLKIKITTTEGLKNELKYCPMSESHTCIAQPNLKVLPFRIFQ